MTHHTSPGRSSLMVPLTICILASGGLIAGLVIFSLGDGSADYTGHASPTESGEDARPSVPECSSPSGVGLDPLEMSDASRMTVQEGPAVPDAAGEDAGTAPARPAWFVSELQRRLKTFRSTEKPTYHDAHWLITSAIVASLELQGRGVANDQGMWMHRERDHVCLSVSSPEGGGRMYCFTRDEFPEYFELKEASTGSGPGDDLFKPIVVSEELCTRLEGRAAAVLGLF